jgi:hypothetical protein
MMGLYGGNDDAMVTIPPARESYQDVRSDMDAIKSNSPSRIGRLTLINPFPLSPPYTIA